MTLKFKSKITISTIDASSTIILLILESSTTILTYP